MLWPNQTEAGNEGDSGLSGVLSGTEEMKAELPVEQAELPLEQAVASANLMQPQNMMVEVTTLSPIQNQTAAPVKDPYIVPSLPVEQRRS